MNEKGFTLIELAIVVTILGILTPAAFMLHRSVSSNHRAAVHRMQAATATRAISEEVRRDMRTHEWAESGTVLLRQAEKCARIEYVIEKGSLIRRPQDGCGPDRALARHVRSIERTSFGMRVHFDAPLYGTRGTHTRVEFGFAGGEL